MEFAVVNVGVGTATNIVLNAFWEVAHSWDEMHRMGLRQRPRISINKQTIRAGDSSEGRAFTPLHAWNELVDKRQFGGVCVYGWVEYTDFLNIKRHEPFCWAAGNFPAGFQFELCQVMPLVLQGEPPPAPMDTFFLR